MRLWRATKTLGCGTLRDGVYLLPFQIELEYKLKSLADEARQEGGCGWLLRIDALASDASFSALFDRRDDYEGLCRTLDESITAINGHSPVEVARRMRKLRRELEAIRAIDYFPSRTSADAEAAWLRYVQAAEAAMSVGEPQATMGNVPQLELREYRGRRWATRKRMWVDRVASAWLIQRFIDTEAEFIWLDAPGDCGKDVLGFDFDGALFTHVGDLVTFEVLLSSFGLTQDPGLARLGAMVRKLDAGGGYVPEAMGFEALMHGARKRGLSDEQLLREIGYTLDSLYAHFAAEHEKEDQ